MPTALGHSHRSKNLIALFQADNTHEIVLVLWQHAGRFQGLHEARRQLVQKLIHLTAVAPKGLLALGHHVLNLASYGHESGA